MKILSLRLKNLNSLKGEWKIDFTREPFASNWLFDILYLFTLHIGHGRTGRGRAAHEHAGQCPACHAAQRILIEMRG